MDAQFLNQWQIHFTPVFDGNHQHPPTICWYNSLLRAGSTVTFWEGHTTNSTNNFHQNAELALPTQPWISAASTETGWSTNLNLYTPNIMNQFETNHQVTSSHTYCLAATITGNSVSQLQRGFFVLIIAPGQYAASLKNSLYVPVSVKHI